MRILMSGGGTAGHIYPALSVAEELLAEGRDDVAFVGTPTGLEARLVPDSGVAFFGLPSKGFDRSRPLTLLTAGLLALSSTVRAIRLIRQWKPDVVVGFGGYVSIPVGLAAAVLKVPLVLHEQNSVPGLANRLLARFAEAIAITYEASAEHLRSRARVFVTGNPVRGAVLRAEAERGREMLGLHPADTALLVFGGSRGARHLNHAVLAIKDEIMAVPDVKVIHIAGPDEADSVRAAIADDVQKIASRYAVYDYIAEMGSCIAAADLVVSRAGATSLAEITALGKPAVLVPYPYATDDHQSRNAESLAAAGGAVVVPDSQLDGPGFKEAVVRLLRDAETRATMAAASRRLGKPEAVRQLARIVRSAAKTGLPAKETG